jgi:cytochrome c553
MKSRITVRLTVFLLGAAGLSAAWAAPASVSLAEQEQQVEAALRAGAKASAVCANCHGANGNSTYPETPNLASQNPGYLLAQMDKFVDGRRRYEFMEGLIKAMTAQERLGAALFYSRQAVAPRAVEDAALRAKGKAYYEKVCFRCHGANGHGSQEYARLAGQQPSYVLAAVRRYRENAPGAARRDPLMAAATKLMTEDDIRAVVAYVSTMP